MAYTTCEYYLDNYLLGRKPVIPAEEFSFWEIAAENELDKYTFGRIKNNSALVTDEVQNCICEIAEVLYKVESVFDQARSQGLAGILTSWSNDGNSGSVDISQSIYTQQGKRDKIISIINLYLGRTGLLYAGRYGGRYES